MLVGSTTSGFVFALDLASGDELWATWVSNDIAGVKGSVACKGGIVVVATDRCTDRYCYRYRNQTNVLTPGNAVVRGLSAADGSSVWSYKTFQPTWNMIPLWGPGDSVMFQDWEGRVYSLNYLTGNPNFMVGGDIGTHTNAHAVYDSNHNVVVALGVKFYTSGRCNPYPAPGILPSCWTWPGTRGFIRGYNASSGRRIWEVQTPEPPASGTAAMLNTPAFHTRLVVTLGHNCYLGSPTQIWGLDPDDGDIRRARNGAGEGADVRRAMGGREKCSPNSWSMPVVDSMGDIYVGNQVGQLMRYGFAGAEYRSELLSTLTTGVAFQDAAIAFGAGVMAVSTCTSLIVFQTMAAPRWAAARRACSGPPAGRPAPDDYVCAPCRLEKVDEFHPAVGPALLKYGYASSSSTFSLTFTSQAAQWKKQQWAVHLRSVDLSSSTDLSGPAWPHRVQGKLNGRQCVAIDPPKHLHVRREQCYNLTPLLRPGSNTLELKFSNKPDRPKEEPETHYCVGVVLTRPRSVASIISRIKGRSSQTVISGRARVEGLIAEVARREAGQDECKVTGNFGRMLKPLCPVSFCPIEEAAIGRLCNHVQVFDLQSYIAVNQRMRSLDKRWTCPVCSLPLRPDDVVLDPFSQGILDTLRGDEDLVEAIVFNEDCSWSTISAVKEDKQRAAAGDGDEGAPDGAELIDLSDSE
ncbi:unnamed protein product [Prorocentrum cordatum]|uniref:SP-RING-type domain-containing protein n=1 Tax=Prorocentrum cordatum TaxID=2364126 RepID=A0ABN9SBH3_9DINO|nr:unnamed protein product [Polarella glacialis]